VEIKGQLDATDWFFIAKLTVRSTRFGHHYAHHQELKIYTDGCCLLYLALGFTGRWSPHQTNDLQTQALSTIGSNHLYKS